jgi:hypothetical protein
MRPEDGSIVFVIMLAIFIYSVRKLLKIGRAFEEALSEYTVETKDSTGVSEEISHFISTQCQVAIG